MRTGTVARSDVDALVRRLRRQAGPGFLVTALLLAGCSDRPLIETASPSTIETPATTDNTQQLRVDQLKGFAAGRRMNGEGCGALAVSNGTVQLDASASRLARKPQLDMDVSDDVVLVAQFGSGFPSHDCTDIPDEIRYATVDETWPASASAARFTVTPIDQCSIATLELEDITVTTPNGQTVDLGDISIVNEQWQWWHPFECLLTDE